MYIPNTVLQSYGFSMVCDRSEFSAEVEYHSPEDLEFISSTIKSKLDYAEEFRKISDTLPGSGESFTSYVDVDIVFDEYGIPYLPAKRIRGILRETAEELDNIISTNNLNPTFKCISMKLLAIKVIGKAEI
ncbi:MAG TPA: hypothetical protein PLP99_11030 [Ignavibacteriales bacterium]|nr:hypothetical protein [Ignavibacteriales bacterium]HOL82272.1 hypothetical protein [Ignavibacteriales bacterium]HPP34492.1 hypothetical protein [Ignavibacteriales bacterium]HRR19630.1 hypothetical protein [Ignavibacteriales bacterium]HRT98705.1 hypothetical protein [Ignavibacteriales bacterium]